VAVIDQEGVNRAAQRVRDFSDRLLSGEVFEIPRSHLIFRIPFFKSLLKRIVKERLRKESKAAV
jgi:hypothetical protein